VVGDCNVLLSLKLLDAIKTLRVLCNQILFVSYQDGFLDLLKSLVLWASMTVSLGMLFLYSTIELWQIQVSGGW